jgi:hypothetical protein
MNTVATTMLCQDSRFRFPIHFVCVYLSTSELQNRHFAFGFILDMRTVVTQRVETNCVACGS